MKFALSWKYQLVDSWKAVVVYYIVIVVLYGIMLRSAILHADMNATTSISGLEAATLIFLFIVGLNSFKDPFLFQIQNGTSRKTIWLGMGGLAVTLTVGMSLCDTLLYILMKAVKPENLVIQSLSDQLFHLQSHQVTAPSIGAQMLFESSIALLAICVGFFICMLYYRMNTTGKTIVSVGAAGMVLMGFPLIERTITHGALTRSLVWVLEHTFGVTPELFRWSIWFIISGGLLYGICYLLIRRAIIKA